MNGVISVIVAAYNAESTIEDMIQSVIKQKYKYWEMIIVDDGSIDSTKDIVQFYTKRDTRIKLISTDNKGAINARNLAYSYAKGEFICILDADDTITEDKFYIQIREFRTLPSNYGVVFGNTWYCDENLENKILDKDLYFYKYPKNDAYFSSLIQGGMFAVHSALIKRSFLDSQEIHKSIHSTMIPDWALWLELSLKCKFKYLSKPFGFYRQHSNMSARKENNTLQITQRKNTAEYIIRSERFEKLDLSTKSKFYFYSGRAFFKFKNYNLANQWYVQSIVAFPLQVKSYVALVEVAIKNFRK